MTELSRNMVRILNNLNESIRIRSLAVCFCLMTGYAWQLLRKKGIITCSAKGSV